MTLPKPRTTLMTTDNGFQEIELKRGGMIEIHSTPPPGRRRKQCPRCNRLIGKGDQRNTLKCKICGLHVGKVTGTRYRVIDWDE